MNKANTRPDLVDKWAAVSSPLKNSHGTLRTWTTSLLGSTAHTQLFATLGPLTHVFCERKSYEFSIMSPQKGHHQKESWPSWLFQLHTAQGLFPLPETENWSSLQKQAYFPKRNSSSKQWFSRAKMFVSRGVCKNRACVFWWRHGFFRKARLRFSTLLGFLKTWRLGVTTFRLKTDGFWIYRNHLAGVTTFVSFDAITSKIKETMTYHIQYCAKPPLWKGT